MRKIIIAGLTMLTALGVVLAVALGGSARAVNATTATLSVGTPTSASTL